MTGTDAPRPARGCGSPVIVVGAPLDSAEIDELCERLHAVLTRTGARAVICRVDAAPRPDLAVLNALARLQVTARRLGGTIRIQPESRELARLLTLAGLGNVIACGGVIASPGGLLVEPHRQPEPREECGGVEEVVDVDDPSG